MSSSSAQSLIKETSTTTGTGSYTLAGAASTYRTFASAYAEGAGCYVPYVARMGSDWEIGIGELTNATTLVRTKVHESSNAGAAVDWAAGAKTIVCGTGGMSGFAGRHNWSAATFPTSTTGRRQDGYGPGSFWMAYDAALGGDPPTVMYMNLVPESDIFDGANWTAISTGHQPMWNYAFDTISKNAVNLYADEICHDPAETYNVTGTGQGARARWSQTHVHGIWGLGDYGGHQYNGNVMMQKETTDATPTVLECAYGSTVESKLVVEENSALMCRLLVTARNNVDDVVSGWDLKFVVKRTGTGNPAIVGSVSGTTAVAQDAAAAAWAVSVGVNTTDDCIEVTVTGAAAKTIRWTGVLECAQVAFV